MTSSSESQRVEIEALHAEVERLRAELAAHDDDGEARWRALVAAAPDHIAICSRDGVIRFLNYVPPTHRIEDVLGRNAFDYVLPEHRQRHRDVVEAVFADGLTRQLDVPAAGADGVVRWYSYRVSRLDHAAREHELVFVARDVTERKDMDAALVASERRYRELAEAVDQVIWMTDYTIERVVYVNPAFERVWGMPAAELYADRGAWMRSIHPDDRERVLALLDECIHGPIERRFDVDYRIVRPDGGVRWIRDRGRKLPEPDGTMRRLAGIAFDITERREIEERTRALNAELERRVEERTRELVRTNRELEAFSYSVGHDLRSPLRAMNAWASILLEEHEGSFGADELDMLERIRRNAVRMGALIDEVLTFSELARRPLVKSRLSLGAVAQDVWRDLAPEPGTRAVDFQVGDLPVVEAEPSLLYQALWHLVSNALKYTRPREHAHIELGVRTSAVEHEIYVRDDGVGFDPSFGDKLFGVFQRLHREEEFEGLGIGLALVQRIAQRHGGRAWAEGVPDRGATVWFSLPR